MKNSKTVYWKDGTSLFVADGITWEYENDADWKMTAPSSIGKTLLEYFVQIVKWAKQ